MGSGEWRGEEGEGRRAEGQRAQVPSARPFLTAGAPHAGRKPWQGRPLRPMALPVPVLTSCPAIPRGCGGTAGHCRDLALGPPLPLALGPPLPLGRVFPLPFARLSTAPS